MVLPGIVGITRRAPVRATVPVGWTRIICALPLMLPPPVQATVHPAAVPYRFVNGRSRTMFAVEPLPKLMISRVSEISAFSRVDWLMHSARYPRVA